MSSFISGKQTATIPSGSSLSDSITIDDAALVAVVIPRAVTVTFQGSLDGTNWYNIYNEDTEYDIVCTVSGLHTVDLNQFLAPRFIKARTGSAASPSAQSSDLTVTIFTKEI